MSAVAAAVAWWTLFYSTPARLTWSAVAYGNLTGWSDDHVAAAVPALLASCAAFAAHDDAAPLDPTPHRGDFGRIGEWRAICRKAAALPPGDAAARRFFETEFIAGLAGNNGTPGGLFTGYYELILNGSRRREGPYQTPIYRRPADPARYTRAEIDDGALAGQGLELLWAENPVDVFFLHIQGSGVVRLRDGTSVRIGYDGQNGRRFVPIGRVLVERGIMPRSTVTMAAIRDWMIHHPQEGAAIRREDPSYVFFREVAGNGALGAEQVVLTAGRSLAVDRAFVPLGLPIWIEADERFSGTRYRRLVIAQDTGGAIRGPVRGDLFWGTGPLAGTHAGAMNARGNYYLLLPRDVASRWPRD